MKPRPQLLILMLIPGFNMQHKYRGPGMKSRMDIVLNLNPYMTYPGF
jgi:hypothetical protein